MSQSIPEILPQHPVQQAEALADEMLLRLQETEQSVSEALAIDELVSP